MSRTPEEIRHLAEKREAKERARELESRLAFEALFSEWLRTRAEHGNPAERDRFEDEDYGVRNMDQEAELARRITTTPSPLAWMVWDKLEVLEHYLSCGGDGTNWTDTRELVVLAGIKADLIRFGIGGNGGGS